MSLDYPQLTLLLSKVTTFSDTQSVSNDRSYDKDFENKQNVFQFLMQSHHNYDFKKNIGFPSRNNSFVWLFLYRLLANNLEFREQCLDFLIQSKNTDRNDQSFLEIRNKIAMLVDELSSDNNLKKMSDNYINAGGEVGIELRSDLIEALKIQKDDPEKLYEVPIKIVKESISVLSIAMENFVEGLWSDSRNIRPATYEVKHENEEIYYCANNKEHSIEYDVISCNRRNYHVVRCLAQVIKKDEQSMPGKMDVYFIQPEFDSDNGHDQVLKETLLSSSDIIEQLKIEQLKFNENSNYNKIQKIQRLLQASTHHNNDKVHFLEIKKPDNFPETETENVIVGIHLKVYLPELGKKISDDPKELRLKTTERRLGAYAIFDDLLKKQLGHQEFLSVLGIRGLSYDEKGNKICNVEGILYGSTGPQSQKYSIVEVKVNFRLKKRFLVACQLGPETYVYNIYDPREDCHHTYDDTLKEANVLQAFFKLPETVDTQKPRIFWESECSTFHVGN